MGTHEVNIKSLADLCRMKSSTLTDYYKEHLSDFRSWAQMSHSTDYIYFTHNIGESISIDETAFSNGELYTIITNKDGHGKKGTLVAMICGTKVEEVYKLLKKIPEGRRRKVRNITLDMAGSMCQIAKKCFPNATQIIDRFHVQKLMSEALQDLRILYRWQVMELENNEMKNAKQEHLEYQAKRFDNGDNIKTTPCQKQIPAV